MRGSQSIPPFTVNTLVTHLPGTPLNPRRIRILQGLTYTWSCTFDAEPCATADGPPLRLPPSPTIAVPAGALLPSARGLPYVFAVAVAKPGRALAYSSVGVHIRAGALPEASVVAVAAATAFQSDGSVRRFRRRLHFPLRVCADASAPLNGDK